jgi:hypothetical protein
MLKDALAIAVQMLGETHPLSPRQNFFQFCFALFKGVLPVILAIQFEQVEGIDEDLIVMRIRGSRSKSDFPSLPHQTASPSTVMDRTLRDRSESTIQGYLRAQS